jgi:hypothetical protein
VWRSVTQLGFAGDHPNVRGQTCRRHDWFRPLHLPFGPSPYPYSAAYHLRSCPPTDASPPPLTSCDWGWPLTHHLNSSLPLTRHHCHHCTAPAPPCRSPHHCVVTLPPSTAVTGPVHPGQTKPHAQGHRFDLSFPGGSRKL